MIDTSPLSGLRLKLRAEEPLAPRTTWRIGGPARFFVEVEDLPALAGVLRWARAEGLPAIPLGKGSNVLVPDEGLDAVVFVLAGDLLAVRVEPPLVHAGGGASLMSLAVTARNAGLSGTEGLSGIPSSVGGAVRINAGAYGTEIFDVLEEATLVSRAGEARVVPASSIPHGYRWSALADGDDVVAGATLRLRPAAREEIDARLAGVALARGKLEEHPPDRVAKLPLDDPASVGQARRDQHRSRVYDVLARRGIAGREADRVAAHVQQAAVEHALGVDPRLDQVRIGCGTLRFCTHGWAHARRGAFGGMVGKGTSRWKGPSSFRLSSAASLLRSWSAVSRRRGHGPPCTATSTASTATSSSTCFPNGTASVWAATSCT